jgi:hypothetical protein
MAPLLVKGRPHPVRASHDWTLGLRGCQGIRGFPTFGDFLGPMGTDSQ